MVFELKCFRGEDIKLIRTLKIKPNTLAYLQIKPEYYDDNKPLYLNRYIKQGLFDAVPDTTFIITDDPTYDITGKFSDLGYKIKESASSVHSHTSDPRFLDMNEQDREINDKRYNKYANVYNRVALMPGKESYKTNKK